LNVGVQCRCGGRIRGGGPGRSGFHCLPRVPSPGGGLGRIASLPYPQSAPGPITAFGFQICRLWLP
jgi:hypothetical protein